MEIEAPSPKTELTTRVWNLPLAVRDAVPETLRKKIVSEVPMEGDVPQELKDLVKPFIMKKHDDREVPKAIDDYMEYARLIKQIEAIDGKPLDKPFDHVSWEPPYVSVGGTSKTTPDFY
jgi:hypothetical protein